MTDLAITATEVLPVSGSTILASGIAGAAITAGQAVYLDNATSTYKLFDANDTAANTKTPAIAMNSPASGQPITVATGGDIVIGATAAATVAKVYVASVTPGGIAPAAQPEATGARVVVIGVAKTGAKLVLILNNTGVTP